MLTISQVINTIKALYPNTIDYVEKNKLYGFLNLFGVRGKTCDTSQYDDIIGGFWLEDSIYKKFPNYESIMSNASTDPSPKYVATPYDAEARRKGGTAWVMEGQHLYYLASWQGAPAFFPKAPIPVYRMPAGKTLDKTIAIRSTSTDTLIHRSWGATKLWNDSAGCQVVRLDDMRKLGDRARIHLRKYPQLKDKNGFSYFTYTLLTQEQIDKYGTPTGMSAMLPKFSWDNFMKTVFNR